MTQTQIFQQLHQNPTPLILANAWDAGSARLVESLGAPAVATSSAAVAWSLGHQDGGHLPISELAGVVARIVDTIRVPLSVDFENGYSDDPSVVAENIKPLFDAGVAGINLEDGSGSPELLVEKIEMIKEAAASFGTEIFINARADVYLARLAAPADRVAESISRRLRYADAGADGLFIPAVTDPSEIRAIVDGVALPLNVLAWSGLPPVSELAGLGVHRLSAGSGTFKVVFSMAAQVIGDFLRSGDSEIVGGGSMDYGAVQALFDPSR